MTETTMERVEESVHKVLAHSYSIYFIFFLLGIILDLIYEVPIDGKAIPPLGFIFLIAGTGLIAWAQQTSRNLNIKNLSHHTFRNGPYKYMRSPTHWGLFLLMLGFGMITDSFFVVVLTIFAFFITRFTFVTKQEKILERKYGSHYTEYKKSVKF
jgi:protein-S-isoprenylcysteine O-methyltransferase Ste14